jgi:predicted TIM-barrel fold metal-dependent hydrolase
MRARVVSADDHVVEPREFWDGWLLDALPARERSRAPRRVGPGLTLDGEGGTSLRTFLLFPELVERSDAADGASDPRRRLAVMDAEGIDVSVVYPQRAMAMWAIDDRALLRRCFDAYNTWLAEWCAAGKGRFCGVPILATVHDPDATAAEIERLRDLGFRTFMLPNSPRGVRYADPALAPMWHAIEDSGMPLSFHISEAPDDNGPGGLGTYLAVSFQPFRKLWAYLVFSGILAAHPRLRLVFAEGGISWVPSALDHADRIHERFADHLVPQLPEPPSHYWFRQCHATFMEDPRGLEQLAHIGADRVLWGADYPHPEGTRGVTADAHRAVVERAGARAAQAILGGNAASVYGFA